LLLGSGRVAGYAILGVAIVFYYSICDYNDDIARVLWERYV